MTPDMKRLCQAAEEAYRELREDTWGDYGYDQASEAIVRAVLMEMKEHSDDMERAAESAGWDDEGRPKDPWMFQHKKMIDAILAEPAKA